MRLAVGSDSPDESERIKAELKEFAEREGFSLDEVFIENLGAKESAFDVLIERLKSSETRNVLVPSLWRFARLPGLQEAMQQHIQRETGAQIWMIQRQRLGSMNLWMIKLSLDAHVLGTGVTRV